MQALVASIDAINRRVGRVVAWSILVIVLLQFAVVIMRYVFGVGSVWVQEAITYVYATSFMATAGYALLRDGQVRVDIFYRGAAPRTKAVVDIVGTLVFLWPVTGLLLWVSFPYVARSFAILEGSRETSGLPFVYLLKAEILIFAGLLALQGLSLLLRSVLVLVGRPMSKPIV
jgi:TRAP-type mannitol/chloroaromatic compound transport system permease small subunit